MLITKQCQIAPKSSRTSTLGLGISGAYSSLPCYFTCRCMWHFQEIAPLFLCLLDSIHCAWGTFCSNQSLVNCHLPINCCFISLSLDSTLVLCISTFTRLLQLDAIIFIDLKKICDLSKFKYFWSELNLVPNRRSEFSMGLISHVHIHASIILSSLITNFDHSCV